MNFWSHSLISVVRLRVSSWVSSAAGKGSPRWCSQYSNTCRATHQSMWPSESDRQKTRSSSMRTRVERDANLLKDAGGDVRKRNWLVTLAYIWKRQRVKMSERRQTGVNAISLPSSMFLIRTLRSATSLSTVKFSLSEVTRRTIVI